MSYTALGIPSGSTPVYLSKDSKTKFRILKGNAGYFIYWLAVGHQSQGGRHTFTRPSPNNVKNQVTITPPLTSSTVLGVGTMAATDRFDLFSTGMESSLNLYLYQSNSYQFNSVTVMYMIICKQPGGKSSYIQFRKQNGRRLYHIPHGLQHKRF